ncbi:MAG TPA: MBL fold metallo-hydrolase [Cellvibrio sp.]|nr:MBL fold metallo-hydrolase [Cellvibrio sp.]
MSVFSIKKLTLAAALVSVTFISGLGSGLATAAAPQVKTSAPGYFRLMLGSFEVTAINDGTVELPVDKLLNNPEPKTHAALADSFLKAPLETSVNAYLINTGEKLVLIDVGAGTLFGPTLGKFVANLRASGYEPAQIDDIYITHLHSDHIGGLVSSNTLAFPNAVVHVDQMDSDFWLSKANLDKAAPDDKIYYTNASAMLTPYQAAKKLSPFTKKTQLTSGIKAVSTAGHTAGHSVYEVESQGQKLWLIGDLIHVAAVQLDHPEVTIAFDSDQKKAAEQRDKIFTQAAKEGILVGAAHIQFPGLGHLRKEGKSYDWIPVNFTQIH